MPDEGKEGGGQTSHSSQETQKEVDSGRGRALYLEDKALPMLLCRQVFRKTLPSITGERTAKAQSESAPRDRNQQTSPRSRPAFRELCV